MAHRSDQDRIEKTRNVPRFFVEHPQVSWVLLVGVLVWGWFGYHSMPQRKDPDIPVRVAVASCSWPGATAQQVEQFVTRPIEDAVAENKTIHPGTAADYGIRSISIPGYAYVYVQLAEDVSDVKRQFSDINLKLNALNGQLPSGAGPITFQSDFGDTAALMLTIASPRADSVEIDIRARAIQSAIETARAAQKYKEHGAPVTIVYSFPQSLSSNKTILNAAQLFELQAEQAGILSGPRPIQGSGFIGVDGVSTADKETLGNQSSFAIPRKLAGNWTRSRATNTATLILMTFRTSSLAPFKVRRKRPRWRDAEYCRRWSILNSRRIG